MRKAFSKASEAQNWKVKVACLVAPAPWEQRRGLTVSLADISNNTQGSALDLVCLNPFLGSLDEAEQKTHLSNLQLTQSRRDC